MSDFMITRRGAASGGGKGTPTFTYTGSYELVDDLGGTVQQGNKSMTNWKLRLLTSGTLTLSELGSAITGVDVFLVGAGGGGSYGGGGGGYTLTSLSVPVYLSTAYEIVIGSGGSGSKGGNAVRGGSTTGFDLTALGGYGAPVSGGGSGGSGGGTFGAGIGGSNGTDGGVFSTNTGGTGQHTTTREFGEVSGPLYAGGGGGGGLGGGAGGAGGGGNGTSVSTPAGGGNGGVNTGGGGGGEQGYGTYAGGSGGSGILIIRNHRA